MFKWFIWEQPTPDEQLIAELKAHVECVRRLGVEAEKRGITVWLREADYGGDIFKPKYIRFEEAYKTNRQKIA